MAQGVVQLKSAGKAAGGAASSGVVGMAAPLQLPHSVEAEQALIGLLMQNNRAFDDLEGFLEPDHFYVPFHGAIFSTMSILVTKGFEANPITIRDTMKDRAQYADGGDLLEILRPIMENASLAYNVRDLAEIIHTRHLQRQLIALGQDITHTLTDATAVFEHEDLQEVVQQTEAVLFGLTETGKSRESAQDMRTPLKMVIEQAVLAKENRGRLIGVTSGFTDVDKQLGGFRRSDLVILAARPSMGKTAIALNIAQSAAIAMMEGRHGGAAVGVFSMEMSADQLVGRMLCTASGIDSYRVQSGDLSNDEFDRLVAVSNSLADTKIYIDDTPQMAVSALRSRARRMVRQFGVGMIVVDYLQLMRGSGKRSENRVQEISEISMGLKLIARELDVPVIALSQLSRNVEARDNKRPQLSDLRESGSIEQDADVVMFLYREEYYLDKQIGANADDPKFAAERERLQRVRGLAELLISKNRKGPTGAVMLHFNAGTTTFHDYAGDVSGYDAEF